MSRRPIIIPIFGIAYGEVTFELTRYDSGGRVTDRDV